MENRNLYETLFKKGMLTDYKIDLISTTSRETFEVHKSLLALNSNYFYTLFNSPETISNAVQLESTEKDNENISAFKVSDKDIEAFKDVVIPYIYHVDDLQITSQNYLSVIYLADFFQITELLNYIKTRFITSTNIIDTIEGYLSLQRTHFNSVSQSFLNDLIKIARESLPQLQPRQFERLTSMDAMMNIIENADNINKNQQSEIICSWIRGHREIAVQDEVFQRLSKHIVLKFSNVLLLYPIAVLPNVHQEDIASECMKIIADNFYAICMNSDIAACSIESIIEILSQDDLVIESEDQIVEAICTYLDNSSPKLSDEESLLKLWRLVRVPLISQQSWLRYINRDDVPLLLARESSRKRAVLSLEPESILANEKQRTSKIQDISPNNQKGIFHWLNAEGDGVGEITVTSSNAVNVGEISDIILPNNKDSRLVLEHHGELTVDFGNFRVQPTFYSIRVALPSGVKNWRLRGSVDGETFDVIRSHEDDTTLENTDSGLWSCSNVSKLYRYLQVQMEGDGPHNDFELELCGIEFYGKLIY